MDVEAGLTIADAARASGLSTYTLRYRERAGLIDDAGGPDRADMRGQLAFIDRKIAIYRERIHG